MAKWEPSVENLVNGPFLVISDAGSLVVDS
jgi:hypothetical protein